MIWRGGGLDEDSAEMELDAARWLSAFVETMKAEGAVAAALARHGIAGASLAPPEPPQR